MRQDDGIELKVKDCMHRLTDDPFELQLHQLCQPAAKCCAEPPEMACESQRPCGNNLRVNVPVLGYEQWLQDFPEDLDIVPAPILDALGKSSSTRRTCSSTLNRDGC